MARVWMAGCVAGDAGNLAPVRGSRVGIEPGRPEEEADLMKIEARMEEEVEEHMYAYVRWEMWRGRGRKTSEGTCLELANWESLPVEEKTTSATSASQSTASSSAFLNSPRLRLEKVTCRAAALSIRRIARLSRAISTRLNRSQLLRRRRPPPPSCSAARTNKQT